MDRTTSRRRVLSAAAIGALALAVTTIPAPALGGEDSTTATPGSEPSARRRPVLVVAHRGASAQAPEHTGAAYDRAMWAGADVLECDLQLTADEQLVCLHDPTVDRTTGGTASGPVSSFTLAQLREMDFGSWFAPAFAGARLVTLEEQISCYRRVDPTLQFSIETKTQPDQADRMEVALVDLLRRLDVVPEFPGPMRSSPVIVQSFDRGSLDTVGRLAPEIPRAYLVGVPAPELATGPLPDVDVVSPSDDVLASSPGLVANAHAQGIEVHPYTVDDPAQMASLVDAGVDGFFTNDPATGRMVVDRTGRGSGREPLDVDPDASGTSAVPTCPAGMGVGLTPVPDEVAPPLDRGTDDASTTGTGDEANDDVTFWPLLAGLAAVGLIAAIVVIVRRRASVSR